MKKRMALLLSAALMLSLTACGGGTEPKEADSSGSTSSTASSSATESANGMLVVGEPYATGAFDITVTGFDFTEQAENPNGDGDLVPSIVALRERMPRHWIPWIVVSLFSALFCCAVI